jgi:transposase
VETNPIRVCELLVGLPEVNVLGVVDGAGDESIRFQVESRLERPVCSGCGAAGWVKDRPEIELVDLPAFGRSVRLVWRKHRWWCPDPTCRVGSWTGEDPRIAAPRLGMTDRAGRWATRQVGKLGRTVAEVARDLGCDWHTVNDTVIA